MAYNRYSNVGGGYPTGSNNIYNQPMPPMQPHQHQHHPHPQYPPYNRNSAGWNMQPGPPLPPQGQGINPWVNNNIPQSFRGYNPMHDTRNHMNMNKPNLRLSQINKRPNDWNNTPNKRPRTIGGNNLNNSTPNNNKQQQPPAQQNLNTTNPKIKKTWVNYNNKNRNFKRRNNNREVKINDKTQDKTPAKKEVPVENVTVSGSDSSTEFDSLQAKHFKSVSGFLCSLCDVFLKDKKCAIEHSKAEPHQTKFIEFKEKEEKAKAEAEKAEAEKKAKEATEESKVVDSAVEISAPNTNGTEQNGQEALDDSKAGDANESTLIDDSAVLSSTDTTLDTSKGPQEATPNDAPSLNALNSEDVIALADESTVSEVAESDEVQPVANRGGKGPRGRGRGRSRGRGRR